VATPVRLERVTQHHRAGRRDDRRPGCPTYLRELVAREEAEGIANAVDEEQRQAVRVAIASRDIRRLREKGPSSSGLEAVACAALKTCTPRRGET
jgi:hypothetical protein